MHQPHFLLSAAARTLSMREAFAMNDDQAFALFREIRWGRDADPVCPSCGVVEPHWFLASRRQWRCRACGHTFSVTSGTIFAHHKLPLQVYLGAAAIYTNAVKGLSALQMSRDLDVQYKTAFVLMHKLRDNPECRIMPSRPPAAAKRPTWRATRRGIIRGSSESRARRRPGDTGRERRSSGWFCRAPAV